MTSRVTRGLTTTLVTSLKNEDTFTYAHLVKFERAIPTKTFFPAEASYDYSYITDASVDISWDDGSTDVSGVSNGSQTYIANRLKTVGSINETTEAKSSNFNITVSAVALNTTTEDRQILNHGTSAAVGMVITTTGTDFVTLGFSEGDKVTIKRVWTGSSLATEAEVNADTNHKRQILIEKFSNSNRTITVRLLGAASNGTIKNDAGADVSFLYATTSSTNMNYRLELSSDELSSLFYEEFEPVAESSTEEDANDKYAGYINREVFIYKTHMNPTTGAMIGDPYLIFKGIIAKAKLQEDPQRDSKVTWSLTSHWGDFVRMSGRKTSDSEHRALSSNGQPDMNALHRWDYANDLGFMHSEIAVNIMAVYQVMETRYKFKSGFFGIGAGQKEYEVPVDRTVDLKFNLEAKSLPIIYGVQRTDSIPIMVDSKYSDSGEIYCVYAICEGEIAGVYDMYIDDESRICRDKNDYDIRAVRAGGEEVEVICEGRMDKGDTMSSTASYVRSQRSVFLPWLMGPWGAPSVQGINVTGIWNYLGTDMNSTNPNQASGMTHEKKTNFSTPIKAAGILHTGKPHQRADDTLVRIAEAGRADKTQGFKLQGDYHDGEKGQYWSQQHRLLDTAYFVTKFDIAEGDITIPQIDFVVRGKELEQYNYDYSYCGHPQPAYGNDDSGNAMTHIGQLAKYQMGQLVNIWVPQASGNPVARAANVQIQDIHKYVNAKEEDVWKVRFLTNPLTYTSGSTTVTGTETEFYVVPTNITAANVVSNDNLVKLVTWDHKSAQGTIAGPVREAINGTNEAAAVDTTVSGGEGIDIDEVKQDDTHAALRIKAAEGGLLVALIADGMETSVFKETERTYDHFQAEYDTSNKRLKNIGKTKSGKENIKYLYVVNACKLPATGSDGGTISTVDDYYTGQVIKVTRTMPDGSLKVQTREIIGYEGSQRVVLVGDLSAATASTSGSVANGTVNLYRATTTQAADRETTELILVAGNATDTAVANLSVGDQLDNTGDYADYVQIHNGGDIKEITTKVINDTGSNVTHKVIVVNGQVDIWYTGRVLGFLQAAGSVFTAQPGLYDFIPDTPDKFEILPPGDKKVSINPAIQLADYLQNKRYGRGLDLEKDLNLASFQQTARLCDTRSDVTVIMGSLTSATMDKIGVGHKFRYESDNTVFWKGTVKSIKSEDESGTSIYSQLYQTGSTRYYREVTFTDCVGKLITKGESWKSYTQGELYYTVSTDGTRVSKTWIDQGSSSSIYATTLSLRATDTALTGSQLSENQSIFLHFLDEHDDSSKFSTAKSCSWDGNPVVKKWDDIAGKPELSGYSLYDSDDVKYWRYVGWQNSRQEEVTRHQTNCTVRTDQPIFNNVNNMLGHFNGILRYSNGKYELDIESTSTTYESDDPRIINQDDIIGAISVEDTGLKGLCNSVTVNIPDPYIRYDTRGITFFNSEYLKHDRGIPKKKDIKTPYVSNYFNARINAEQYLVQSRSNKKINFQMGPKGVLLLAGTIIKLSYPRFGWDNKYFRISNLSIRQDCLVQVTATEHDENSYIVSGRKKTLGGAIEGGGVEPLPPTPAPIGLTATTNLNGKVELTYETNVKFTPGVWKTRIYSASSSTRPTYPSLVKTVDSVQGENIEEHNLQQVTSTTSKYYWITHTKQHQLPKTGKTVTVESAYFPTGAGVLGTASVLASTTAGTVYIYKLSDQGTDITDSDIGTNFPDLVVATDPGNTSTFNKINAIASGQGSGALGGTFPNHTITGEDGNATGWQTFLPTITGTKNIWLTGATVSSVNATDTIAQTEWATPIKYTGQHGESSFRVIIYKKTAQSDATHATNNPPSGNTTYNFTTGAWTGTTDSWSLTEPAPDSTNQYVYRTHALALAVTPVDGSAFTDTIGSGEWDTRELINQYVAPPTNGSDGESGPRHTHGFVYYSTGQATSPGNPTASSYSFTNSAFTNLATGWGLQSPTATPGATSSKYWYATFTAKEGITNGSGTGATTGTDGSLTFGTAYEGLNFTGLVTFNALSTSGSTTIHGGNITTGTIAAARISLTGKSVSELTNDSGYTNDDTANAAQSTANSANLAANSKNKTFYSASSSTPTALVVGDIWVQTDKVDVYDKYKIATATGTSNWVNMNPSKVGSWTLDANSLYSGSKDTSGYTGQAGHITLNSGGSIHTPNFYVNSDGSAGFRGTVTIGGSGGTELTNANTLNENAPLGTGANTVVGAGIVRLANTGTGGDSSASASQCVEINATTNQILIKEGGNIRVKLGKLS